MSCLRRHPFLAKAALGAVLLTLVTGLAACDEDGKTAPADCVDPQPYDIQGKPVKSDNDCVNGPGDAVSSSGPVAGTSAGGSTTTAGSGGGAVTADAGAGGAGGAP